MNYYPIYLNMTERRCLVIGGGAVAERKIAGLLEVGAKPTVVSPAITDTIAGWAKDHAIELIARRYQASDLTEHEIVFVATDDGAANAQVFSDGRRLGGLRKLHGEAKDAFATVPKGRSKHKEEKMNCSHGPCSCNETHMMSGSQQFCSEACVEAAERESRDCACGHPDCEGMRH